MDRGLKSAQPSGHDFFDLRTGIEMTHRGNDASSTEVQKAPARGGEASTAMASIDHQALRASMPWLAPQTCKATQGPASRQT